MTLTEWVELARELGERKFVARHDGFYLLATEDSVELQTMLQTTLVPVAQPAKRRLASRNFDIRTVAKAERSPEPSPISIGRSRTCDIMFRHPSVSKLHAQLVRTGKQLLVTDLGSRNGTSLNGKSLPAEKAEEVLPEDRIQFGSVQTMVLGARELFDLVAKM